MKQGTKTIMANNTSKSFENFSNRTKICYFGSLFACHLAHLQKLTVIFDTKFGVG
jgi:hypothetical protein